MNAEPHAPWDRLCDLRVADVMSRRVVTVRAGDGMEHVSRVFRRHDVSASPVVDDQGRCVGILSAADFVKREYQCHQPAYAPPGMDPRRLETNPADGSLQIAAVTDTASTYMSSGVQSIAESRSVLSAAQIMCAQHVHRLVVVDDGGRPTGMVSTMDIVAALLNILEASQLDDVRPG